MPISATPPVPASAPAILAVSDVVRETPSAPISMSGRMVCLQGGTYRHIPIGSIMQGLKRVDVAELYDVEEYRPKVRHVLGKPMFLY